MYLKETVILIYIAILIMTALIDWKTKTIDDRVHVGILVLAVLHMALSAEHGIGDRLLGLIIVSVPMLVICLLFPGAFGGGDIKLMAVSGLLLGAAPVICAAVLGFMTGGVYAAGMLITGKLDRKAQFAFGPSLCIGLMIAALAGDRIVKWYLG